MDIVIITICSAVVIAGLLKWMIRLDRVNRERAERRRADWLEAGGEGAPPDNYISGGGPGISG